VLGLRGCHPGPRLPRRGKSPVVHDIRLPKDGSRGGPHDHEFHQQLRRTMVRPDGARTGIAALVAASPGMRCSVGVAVATGIAPAGWHAVEAPRLAAATAAGGIAAIGAAAVPSGAALVVTAIAQHAATALLWLLPFGVTATDIAAAAAAVGLAPRPGSTPGTDRAIVGVSPVCVAFIGVPADGRPVVVVTAAGATDMGVPAVGEITAGVSGGVMGA